VTKTFVRKRFYGQYYSSWLSTGLIGEVQFRSIFKGQAANTRLNCCEVEQMLIERWAFKLPDHENHASAPRSIGSSIKRKQKSPTKLLLSIRATSLKLAENFFDASTIHTSNLSYDGTSI